MSRLLESADRLNKQRLNRLACEHANAWVTALPSEIDGKESMSLGKMTIITKKLPNSLDF
jgi:hypothetical protein